MGPGEASSSATVGLMMACMATTTPAATYYVDPRNPQRGDHKPGTATQPFKTLKRSTEVAKPGDTIHLEPDNPLPGHWARQRRRSEAYELLRLELADGEGFDTVTIQATIVPASSGMPCDVR